VAYVTSEMGVAYTFALSRQKVLGGYTPQLQLNVSICLEKLSEHLTLLLPCVPLSLPEKEFLLEILPFYHCLFSL
jgi:hypothetical protein